MKAVAYRLGVEEVLVNTLRQKKGTYPAKTSEVYDFLSQSGRFRFREGYLS